MWPLTDRKCGWYQWMFERIFRHDLIVIHGRIIHRIRCVRDRGHGGGGCDDDPRANSEDDRQIHRESVFYILIIPVISVGVLSSIQPNVTNMYVCLLTSQGSQIA